MTHLRLNPQKKTKAPLMIKNLTHLCVICVCMLMLGRPHSLLHSTITNLLHRSCESWITGWKRTSLGPRQTGLGFRRGELRFQLQMLVLVVYIGLQKTNSNPGGVLVHSGDHLTRLNIVIWEACLEQRARREVVWRARRSHLMHEVRLKLAKGLSLKGITHNTWQQQSKFTEVCSSFFYIALKEMNSKPSRSDLDAMSRRHASQRSALEQIHRIRARDVSLPRVDRSIFEVSFQGNDLEVDDPLNRSLRTQVVEVPSHTTGRSRYGQSTVQSPRRLEPLSDNHSPPWSSTIPALTGESHGLCRPIVLFISILYR